MSKKDTSVPCSPTIEVAGALYFPRMIEKIRLHAKGELRADLHDNLGKGLDGWLCDFLRVSYDALKSRALEGGSDEEILAWCQTNGHLLNDSDKLIWRSFVLKLGWNDRATALLEKRKAESGLSHRDDIVTMAHYIDADEGRDV
jgi:Domain of unknown function (DUF5069)